MTEEREAYTIGFDLGGEVPAKPAGPQPFVDLVLTHRVIDGDSLHLTLDLGYSLRTEVDCRLMGIDAPERNTDAGKAVKQVVEHWIESTRKAGELLWISQQLDKYGRTLGDLQSRTSGELLTHYLRIYRLVRLYEGGTRHPWPDDELARIVVAAGVALRQT